MLSSLNQEETLCKTIQQRRLTWFGYAESIEKHRIMHKVLHWYIIGNRSRGRQRKTWMDNVKTNA